MGIWFWILCAILIFAAFGFVRKWHDYAALFTIAIGFAVNANIYNSATTPIDMGGMVFAVDSILYTGFMFAVLLCAHEYGFKKAKILNYTSIAAILVSACIEMLANVSAFGYQTQFLNSFLGYIYSAVGTLLGVWVMLQIYKRLEKRKLNEYGNFLVCILVASLINTTVYYMGTILTTGQFINNMGGILLGSYIGKCFCILLCQVVFLVNTHWWIPNALKAKYKKQTSTISAEQNVQPENESTDIAIEKSKNRKKTTSNAVNDNQK